MNPTPKNPAMTAPLHFEHFATLATAPEGIPRLRELILQLAVQGKLGTQDPRDEPARVLLERITTKKERSAKGGKNKKEKPLEPKGELAFQLPKTWICSPLGAILSFEYGESLPEIKREDSGKVPVYGSNGIVGYHSKAITKGPSLIIGRKGSVGAIQITNVPCHPIDTAYYIDNFENLDQKFLFYLLTSLKLGTLDKSTAIPGLNRNDAYNLLIGFPPIVEQHRIVAKVDRLMALCDELEAKQQKERAGCLKLGNASLTALQNVGSPEEFERQWAQVCEAFGVIFDCPENVAVLRQTILQMAILGKMDTHDPKDEPVEKLLEKIRKEKLQLVTEGKSKKEKPLEPVNVDEVPFILPERWMWCRFGDIATIETNIVPPDKFQNLPHVAPDNIEKRTGRLLHYRTVAEDDVQSPNHHFFPNQIVYSKIRPNLSKLTIVDFEGLCSADMYPIFSHIFNKYLKIYMLSWPFYNQAVGDENRLAMPKINQTQLNLIYVAVPPLAEQHRIVAKVDALMALCDALESRLKKRAAVQGRFAAAVGKQVAT